MNLAAHYTIPSAASFLISRIQSSEVSSILDLGAGYGSLLKAANSKWPNSKIYAFEVDSARFNELQSNYQNSNVDIDIQKADVNKGELEKIKPGTIDVAVCNPPYLSFPPNIEYKELLESVDLKLSKKLPRLTTDIIFLAQNLKCLKEGGELGIILPDSILTSQNFSLLRQDLIQNHSISEIIQLPDKIFSGIEARTHIMLLRRGKSTCPKVSLKLAAVKEAEIEIVNSIEIDCEQLYTRMDYNYWNWRTNIKIKKKSTTLGDIDAEIIRGSVGYKECRESQMPFFHTTNFIQNKNQRAYFSTKIQEDKYRTIKYGDILLSRVGKRCVGRVAIVRKGSCVLTDCVYRIRIPKKFRESAFNALASSQGQQWLKAHAHGVCAQVISKRDLLNFPI